jgi:ATP-dependent DNA helicase DinG
VASRTLNDNTKDQIRTGLQNVRDQLDGFRPRYVQRKMIGTIASTLSEHDVQPNACVVEGPTGTGKTLAYLLAAIPMAQQQKKKLIISSATIALQEQLTLRDLPDMSVASAYDFSYTLAKGRQRYVCNQKLLADENSEQSTLSFDKDMTSNAEDRHIRSELIQALKAERWDGERDHWADSINDGLWQQISTPSSGCLKNRCPHIRECKFYRAREAMNDSDVIVANHDLVLSDLSLGGGVILPEPSESIYVFDEAHHLSAKAVDHFGATLKLHQSKEWLNRIGTSVNKWLISLSDPYLSSAAKLLQDNQHEALTLVEQCQQILELNMHEALWRFEPGTLPDSLRDIGSAMLKVGSALQKPLQSFHKALEEAVSKGGSQRDQQERYLMDTGFIKQQLDNWCRLWHLMMADDDANAPPTARWIDFDNDYTLCAAPTSVANQLDQMLWQCCGGVVLTSATLTALGRFDRFLSQTGLDQYPHVECLRLASPFDFQKNGVLHVPQMKSNPTDSSAHTEEITSLLPDLFSPGGNLVLFNSRRQMLAVAENMPKALSEHLLVQGALSKNRLLEQHRENLEEHPTSIIFGLASFAEGIDLPGELCRHVIIARIPFSPPDSPIAATLSEWLETQGRKAFWEMTLPDASMKLVQATGRLLRSESDQGQVTILDRRIVSKSYGRQLLSALPPYRQDIVI